MFSAGVAVGNVQPYFLTQAEVDLDRTVPLEQQPELQQITGQALQTADMLADFMGGATQALDIAIYDFRLRDCALTADGTIATGSFNFSANATRNAENVLRISSADLADQYEAYIEGVPAGTGTAVSPA